MGQKCNSNAFRLGFNKNWLSRWNSPDKKTTIKWILEDEKIRAFFNKYCEKGGVGLIEIERFLNLQNFWTFCAIVHLVQPGLFLPEKEIEYMTKIIRKIIGKDIEIKLLVLELKNPGVSANILAYEVATALENKAPFRSTLKKTLKKALMSGAKGIKIKVTGRINGVEMSRSEYYSEGSIPMSTLRSDIDYCFRIAKTSYGVLGVKIWINRGLYFGKYFMPLPAEHKIIRNSNRNKFIANTY